jgi:predicted DNA-binding transcriptional regulator YafY
MTQTGNKNRILFLQQYLLDHTDDDHALSTEDLIRICEESGFKANRHTIKDDVDALNASGTEIISERAGGGKTYYHVGTRLFELAEVKLLADAVSSSQFITKAKSDALIEKLSLLTNEQNRASLSEKIFTAAQIKTTNPVVFQTIDAIYKAIDAGKKIAFHYYSYTPEKRRILKNAGEEYIVSPYALIWNDARYYLAAQYTQESSPATFRIDRIHDVKLLDEPAAPAAAFDASEYASRTVMMYDEGAEEQEVVLACENKLMQNVVDKFGEEIETDIIDDSRFSARVTVRPSRTFFSWAFGFCGGICIVGPEDVREKYEGLLRKVLDGQVDME